MRRTKRLPEHTINAQDMLQDIVENHQLDIKLLLVEHAQSILDVLTQFLCAYGAILLGQPVTEQDGPLQCVRRHGREVLGSHAVHELIRPHALRFLDQAVLEETERLSNNRESRCRPQRSVRKRPHLMYQQTNKIILRWWGHTGCGSDIDDW